MGYQTAEAKREFDKWSRHYDQDVLQIVFFRPAHRMLLGCIQPTDRRILDIGCGTGAFASRVLSSFPEADVVGLDLSDGMLRGARERLANANGRLHLVQGDSQRLPFANDAFDVVTCSHSFHHYPDQTRVVAEMHRVLRPGGKVLIIDGDRDGLWGRLVYDGIVVLMEGDVKHLSAKAFRSLYEHAGFENISQRHRGGPLPFLMTTGIAGKSAREGAKRRAA